MRGHLTTEDAQAAENDERAEALAAFGLRLEGEGAALPVFHLWPEHAAGFSLWAAGQSHLRYSPTGIVLGVDHDALDADIRRSRRVRLPGSPRRRAAAWRDFCTIERAALAEWRVQRDRAG